MVGYVEYIRLIYFGINSSMVDSLFIFAHIVWGSFVFGPWFVVSFLVLQSSDSKLVALLFIVFLQSCDCFYPLSLIHGTVCCAAVCDCGISASLNNQFKRLYHVIIY